MFNEVVLIGRLTQNPELKYTATNTAVCSFNIAINRTYKVDGKEVADFPKIVAWRQKAEFVAKYFVKGKAIGIRGSLQTRNYEDEKGQKRQVVEVIADKIFFVGDANKNKEDNSYPEPPPEYAKNEPVHTSQSTVIDDTEDFKLADDEDLLF